MIDSFEVEGLSDLSRQKFNLPVHGHAVYDVFAVYLKNCTDLE